MEKIDVVVAWVDGSDPQHAAKRRKFQKKSTLKLHPNGTRKTRFADRGEIYYCIASILKYASFVNKIWVVTDDQEPKYLSSFADAGLCRADFIQIVDHRTIFEGLGKTLPTFSARAIEAVTWRIPDLSEHFIYLNDDFFLNKPLTPDFLFQGGKPVLRGRMVFPNGWLRQSLLGQLVNRIAPQEPNTRPSFRIAQELGASLAGSHGRYMLVGHHPHPMRRSVLAAFFDENPSVLAKQTSYRFRSIKQFTPAALANHLEILRHGARVHRPATEAYIRPDQEFLAKLALNKVRRGSAKYGCIQNMDAFPTDRLAELRSVMGEKFAGFLPEAINFQEKSPPEQSLSGPG